MSGTLFLLVLPPLADTEFAGYSPTLAALGLPPGAKRFFSTVYVDLLDKQVVTGEKGGYRFTYAPGPRDAHGRVESYTVGARPIKYGKTGTNSYFTDQTEVIHITIKGRPATATDPPLAG